MIYVIIAPESNIMKIGVSSDPQRRLDNLRGSFPFPLEILYVIPKASYREERKLHWELREHRLQGEWFEVTPESMRLLRSALSKYPLFDAKGWQAQTTAPSVLNFIPTSEEATP
jgi:hypothetical protein